MTLRSRFTAITAAVILALGSGAVAARLETPVADAAMQQDLAAVRALLAKGADVTQAQGDGMTALHWADERGNVELTSLLIGAGAPVSAETRLGKHTPLHIAARGGHGAIVQQLLAAGANARVLTTTGAAPLHFAAASGDEVSVRALLDAGAEVDVKEPSWGQTPLMFAASSGRTAVVKLLVARGASTSATAKVVDLEERNRTDSADSRAPPCRSR